LLSPGQFAARLSSKPTLNHQDGVVVDLFHAVCFECHGICEKN
jgi:hypothetical protein